MSGPTALPFTGGLWSNTLLQPKGVARLHVILHNFYMPPKGQPQASDPCPHPGPSWGSPTHHPGLPLTPDPWPLQVLAPGLPIPSAHKAQTRPPDNQSLLGGLVSCSQPRSGYAGGLSKCGVHGNCQAASTVRVKWGPVLRSGLVKGTGDKCPLKQEGEGSMQRKQLVPSQGAEPTRGFLPTGLDLSWAKEHRRKTGLEL